MSKNSQVNVDTCLSPHAGQPQHHTMCVPVGRIPDANTTKLHWEPGRVSLVREEQEFLEVEGL